MQVRRNAGLFAVAVAVAASGVVWLVQMVFGVANATAQEGTLKPRVLVIVEERVGAGRSGAAGAEPELVKRFLAAGYQVVERYESEGVLSRIPLERMLHGQIAGNEVSAINADVLVLGRVELQPETLPYGVTGHEAYSASMELRVILTDSGRVAYSGQLSQKGVASAAVLASRLAGKLFDEMLPKIGEALASRPVIELRVAGLKSASDAEALGKKLQGKAGVKEARARFVSGTITVIDLAASGVESAALDGVLAAAKLKVTGRSANVIEASLDETALARRELVVAAFINASGNPGLDWIAALGPEIWETELSNSQYLQPHLLPTRPAGDPKAAAAAARSARVDLAMLASVEMVGKQLRLTARAIKPDGALLATAQEFGEEATVVDVLETLVWRIEQQLYKKVNPQGSLAGYQTKVKRNAPPGAVVTAEGLLVVPAAAGTVAAAAADSSRPKAARLVISDVSLDPIFPSQLGRYALEAIGYVAVENVGSQRGTAVRVGARFEDLSDGTQYFKTADLEPAAQTRVPLPVVFDRAKLLAVSQRRPIRVEISLRYHDGVEERNDSVTEPAVLHDRNAMNWSDAGAISAFVTHRDPFVQSLARNVLERAGKDSGGLSPVLHSAVALFDAVQALKVRYQRDPIAGYGAQAIDAIQFPRETILRRAGDCDDLAVLYAALLAAGGIDARMVLTPGHIFVLVDSGLSAENAKVLGGPARTVVADGRAWVPIEITKLEGGFAAAWAAGITELGRYRGSAKLSYLDIRRSWSRFPPFPVEGGEEPPDVPAELLAQVVRSDIVTIAEGKLPSDARQLPAIDPLKVARAEAVLASDPRELLRAGAAAARQGDFAQAVTALTVAVEQPAVASAARNNLGNVYTMLGRYEDAIEAYEQAARDKSISSEVQTNLGIAYFQAGQGTKAKAALQAARTERAERLLVAFGLASKDDGTASRLSGRGQGSKGSRESRESRDRSDGGRSGKGSKGSEGGEGGKPGKKRGDGTGAAADASLDWGMRADGGRANVTQDLFWIE
ncbi:MAG: tetratricopeptide repeat protein [Pseudomonadota bacterium]